MVKFKNSHRQNANQSTNQGIRLHLKVLQCNNDTIFYLNDPFECGLVTSGFNVIITAPMSSSFAQ